MKQILISLIASFLLLPVLLIAQSAEEKAKKILSVFETKENLYLAANISLYQTGDKTPRDTLSFVFQRSKKQEYFRLGDLEFLNVGSKVLVADHDEKMVSVAEQRTPASMDNFFNPSEVAALVKADKTIITEEPTGDEMGGLKVSSGDSPLQWVFIKYDKNTYRLREIQVTGPDPVPDDPEKDPPIITLIAYYHTIESRPKPFSYALSNYVVQKNGHYIGTGKCRGYEVLSD